MVSELLESDKIRLILLSDEKVAAFWLATSKNYNYLRINKTGWLLFFELLRVVTNFNVYFN